MKRQKGRTLKDELLRSVNVQYATGDQWRNNSRKSERMEPKRKQHPLADVTGDRSKFRCCKEQYCIGTRNVRSMNQGKLEVVKQEMARVKEVIKWNWHINRRRLRRPTNYSWPVGDPREWMVSFQYDSQGLRTRTSNGVSSSLSSSAKAGEDQRLSLKVVRQRGWIIPS